jgi:hypothetical protein
MGPEFLDAEAARLRQLAAEGWALRDPLRADYGAIFRDDPPTARE